MVMARHFLDFAYSLRRPTAASVADCRTTGRLRALLSVEPRAVSAAPKRPDATMLSETIPLCFIGRNGEGFWAARDAEGQFGGLFLCKRSAVRFAEKRSAPRGCATMFLSQRFDFDIENEGNPLVTCLLAAKRILLRRAPKLAAFASKALAQGRALAARISRAHAQERRHREAIERELFDGQYRLSSKNDDDLPVIRSSSL
jgi:hypothetical protein